MKIAVQLFGPEAQRVGRDHVCVELPTDSVTGADLRRILGEMEPKLRSALTSCRFAVNHCFVSDQMAIGPGDEVALIGLVSGG